nr:hypothetical protein [Tanacetum cinerariifolium]
MSILKFAEVHNLVAFLSKPTGCEGFEQIVDFLNANPISYALTVNPAIYIYIYISCIEQFWTTAKAKTINREGQLQALVDEKKILITELTLRRDLLEDAEGVDCLPNAAIFEQLTLIGMVKHLDSGIKFLMYPRRDTPLFATIIVQAQAELGEDTKIPTDTQHTPTIIQPTTSQPQRKQKPRKTKRKDTELPQTSMPTKVITDDAVYEEIYDSVERADTTAIGLDAEQDRGIIRTSSCSGPKCQETIGDTIAQTRILDLENTKTTQALEIGSLKIREKKLEKKQKSKTHKLKRLYKVGLTARVDSSDDNEDLGEDASKQGMISPIDADEDITLVNDQDDEQMFDADQDLHGEEVFVSNQDENVVEKEVDAAQVQVTTATTTPTISINKVTLAQALAELKHTKPKSKAKGIVFHETKKSTKTTKTIPKSKSQDKGKSIMVEEPMKLKKKNQIQLDEEVALKLQAEFKKEQRLAEERAQ